MPDVPHPPPSADPEGEAATNEQFGRFVIPASSIFCRSRLSVSFVNLRPIVPGHVLVMPRRCVPLLDDLTPDEYDDLWRTVREAQRVLRQHYGGAPADGCTLGFNVAVQDGPEAGQSVPHVHVHVLPRISNDLARNDDVYEALEVWSPRPPDQPGNRTRSRLVVADDDQRRDRTLEEMAQEAALYRSYL
jgi:bis(5'-adenosyl)-triphosphatase